MRWGQAACRPAASASILIAVFDYPVDRVPDESRLELLETKVAHLERALQELSDVLYRQQTLLDVQQARYQRLVERVEASDRQPGGESQFEVPPHY